LKRLSQFRHIAVISFPLLDLRLYKFDDHMRLLQEFVGLNITITMHMQCHRTRDNEVKHS